MCTAGTSHGGESDDARVRRRREINRNSQKRIRERRNKEMDGLKSEVRNRREACRMLQQGMGDMHTCSPL